MPVETILFLDDRLHASNTAASIYGASSTASGFYPEAVRDTDYLNGWRPNNSTVDEHVTADGGVATWIGAALATAYVVVAYDARGSDQNTFEISADASDSPVGTFAQTRAVFTLNKTAPTCEWKSFAVAATAQRYFRLWQFNTNRGGGTKPATVLAWAMFPSTGVLNLDTGYSGIWVSPGRSDLEDDVARISAPSGFGHFQASGRLRNAFELRSRRAKKALWTDLVDRIHAAGGGSRAFFVQYEGLKNPALAGFQMARISDTGWAARRPQVDGFDLSIPMRTEVHV